MKSKNIIFFSVIISTGIASCNNPFSGSTTDSIYSTPSVYPSVVQSSYNPTPTKMGVIRTFIENKDFENNYDSLFSETYGLNGATFSINNNQIYYSNGNTIYQYNLANSKLETKTGNCYHDFQSQIAPASSNKFCEYSNSKVKKGRNNSTYLFNNFKVAKIDGESISDIYSITNYSSANNTISEIAVDQYSNIYIIRNNIIGITKINSYNKEEKLLTKDTTSGEKFYQPQHLEVDKNGNIYFFDNYDYKIKKITPDSVVTTIVGGGSNTSTNIPGKEYKFSATELKLSIDNNDNLYISEKLNNRILKYDQQTSILTTFAGGISGDFKEDNKPATQSGLNAPLSITFDSNNNAYIFDSGNKAIKKVNAKTGLMSVVMGSSPSHGDGNNLSKVSLKGIYGIYSKNNNLYIGELDRVRKIDNKGVISTIAGNGQAPAVVPSSSPITNENNLTADKSIVFTPQILYIDNENNIYISERNWIRKITTDNKLVTIPSELSTSESITGDSKGNLYFSSGTIKKVDKNNNIQIFAGKILTAENSPFPPPPTPTPQRPLNVPIEVAPTVTSTPLSPDSEYFRRDDIKDGSNAKDIYRLDPRSIVSDSKDNIYAIATYTYNFYNSQNDKSCIIKISPDGTIKVIAGNSKDKAYSESELTNSSEPSISIAPRKLIIDKEDNLYFIDAIYTNNNIIRKIDNQGKISIYAGKLSVSNNQSSINDIKAKEAIFNHGINDITIDDNGYLYFSTNDSKIYRIE